MTPKNIYWPGWETVRRIGEGSYGAVYEIQRELVDGTVAKAALKVISIPQKAGDIAGLRADGYDDESIRSTFRSHLKSIVGEYSTMQKMNGSSNIVNCDDVHYQPHADGFGWDVYIKMELLTPLVDSLSSTISEETVIKVGTDICAALVLCQRYDVIHRDVKPQNIFISSHGDYKLGDFGIAKTVEKTTGGTITGSPNYMAPEVYNNQPYGAAADQCSLGLVMYWMLNERRVPFLPMPPRCPSFEETETARYRRFMGEELPAPKNGSDELKHIVLKACAFDPKDRFASAREMLDALRNLSDDPSVIPVAESPENVELPEEEATVGPAFTAVIERTEGPVWNNSEKNRLPEEDQTVGPVFSAPERVRTKLDVNAKKNPIVKIAAIGAAVLILILLLRSCFGGSDRPVATEAIEPTELVTEMQTEPPSTEPEETEIQTEPEETLPVQQEWSKWMDELPDYVDDTAYEIQERTRYRSEILETTTSTTQSTMDGWKLAETKEEYGEYGEWTKWSETKATKTDSRDVESETWYSYKTKETTTSSKSEKSGWTLYDTTYSWGEYGAWSDWSKTEVTESGSREVKSKKQYRYADKLTTSSTSSSLSGWTQYDSSTSWSDYGGWSGWSETAVSGNDAREVQSERRYKYYCFTCSRCGARIPYQSGTSYGICYTELGGCGSKSFSVGYHETFLTNPPSDAKLWAYNKRCLIVDGQRWYINTGQDPVTVYRYRDRSKITTYYYWKWDDWSSWSDTKYTESDTRQVKSRRVYKYRDREKEATYHFYRWSDWSDWSKTAVSETENRKVKSAQFYRSRERALVKTYYFQRIYWTDWSKEPHDEAEGFEIIEVETKQQFRFRSK